MGQSLAPLLLGEAGWEPRPVVCDEFEVDKETGEYRGRIEMIDGRWGAALQINVAPDTHPRCRREAPLLLFDLWEDPYCLRSLHAKHPYYRGTTRSGSRRSGWSTRPYARASRGPRTPP